jgi:hypothetical protein
MYMDLYGEIHEDRSDWARKIITKGYSIPFLKVSMEISGSKNKLLIAGDTSPLYKPGIYTIYFPRENNSVCAYVGQTYDTMYYRTYRFLKEIHGVSRHDEDHPGAKRARVHNDIPEFILVKPFPFEHPEFPYSWDFIYSRLENIDETIAVSLKSLYNKTKKW